MTEGFGHGGGDGVGVVGDGEEGGLVEVVAAETDLERGLDDGGLLGCGEGVTKVDKGAVDEGEGDVVDRGGAAEGEGDEAVSGVHEGTITWVTFRLVTFILEVLQVDAVDGSGGIELERVGFGLEGDVGRCSVDELIETRVSALRALVADCGRVAEIAGEVGLAVEGDGYLVGVGGVCVFAVDVAFLRDKSLRSQCHMKMRSHIYRLTPPNRGRIKGNVALRRFVVCM